MKLFCAEALWDNEIGEGRPSYKSLLNLVRNETGCKVAYFTFNTPEELSYLIDAFHDKSYDILYIASHMEKGDTLSGLKKKFRTKYVPLLLSKGDKLKDKHIHLAGCSSLDRQYVNPESIVKELGLKSLSGYTLDTDTTESSAIELLFLTYLINEYGIDIFTNKDENPYSGLIAETGFSLVIGNKE